VSGEDDFAALSDAALLRSRGLFVAEGRLVLRRVLDDPRYRVESILVNEAGRADLADALDALPPGVALHVRPTEDFRALTGFNLHRGCVALVWRPPPVSCEELLARATARVLVVLEGVTDADNVGAVFRNAAAFGAAGVLLDPRSCDPLYRKAVRTSMAAVLRVPFARAGDWPGALTRVRAAGYLVAALTPRMPSQPLDAFAPAAAGRRIALVIGSEGAGLSAAVEAQADARVRIPMSGGIDSINLSVAAALALSPLR
jgi:tRNA G18 (ribose-2'-O)-methylase SpoU